MSPATTAEPRRFDVLGVHVSAVDVDGAVETLDRWIADRQPNYVCVTGAHGVIESWKDPALRGIHNRAGMVTADGMPLVWLGRRSGYPEMSRVYGPDLMRAVLERASGPRHRHFFFGGAPGVAERLASTMGRRNPSLDVVGIACPPFRPPTLREEEETAAAINAVKPDIVWVGLSTPKQEYWMARNASRIDAPVLIGVGAAFDFLAGTKRQAPIWMQRSGLEWSYRLASEPRRLWRRYALIVPGFAVLVALDRIGLRFGTGAVSGTAALGATQGSEAEHHPERRKELQ